MIILNEFLPADLLRRQFADQDVQEKGAIQMRQLEKARNLLAKIMREYQNFPYLD
jgi:hypothetical protein